MNDVRRIPLQFQGERHGRKSSRGEPFGRKLCGHVRVPRGPRNRPGAGQAPPGEGVNPAVIRGPAPGDEEASGERKSPAVRIKRSLARDFGPSRRHPEIP